MFSTNFKIALRNIIKQKTYSFINISGLSIGIACCMLIAIYLQHELSFDRFHKHADRTYRFTREFISPDGSTSLHLSRLAPPFAPLLQNDFPELETTTRFVSFGGTLQHEDKVFHEDNIGWADNNFFKIFSFDFIQGDPATALSQPGSLAIDEEMALKYFGTTDVIGKVIRFANQANLKVTGVFKTMPENAHFNLSVIGDFFLVEEFYGGRENMMQNWGSNNFSTYFILKEGATLEQIERRLPDFLTKHLGETANEWTALHIQKMTDIHLHSQLDDELGANSDIKYIYIFSAIALLILTIAAINYMNLTTAKSVNRAREVGMRKVMGADKSKLILQFMTESVAITMIAVIFAAVLVLFTLPYLGDFTGRTFIFSNQEIFIGLISLLGFGIFTGILAGSYPSFFLSSFQPIKALKGQASFTNRKSVLRQSLVVIQFSISAVLIIATAVVFQQLYYIQHKNLGYNKEHIVTLQMNEEIQQAYEVFRKKLTDHPDIVSMANSSRVPTNQLLDSQGAKAEIDGQMVTPQVVIKNLSVDDEFIPTYGISLVAGRNFDPTMASDDTAAFIINEAASKMIGWPTPQEAIGKKVTYANKTGRVIGVMRDIHFETLQNKISPMIMHMPETRPQYISVKMTGNDVGQTMDFIKNTWDDFSPNTPIRYQFVDDRFDRLYEAENQRAQLFTAFSILAIFLACLGLFGLTSFTVSQRSREISIRKVLGAEVSQVVASLSREFLLLVGISIVVALPIAWLLMADWLNQYAYRTTLTATPFLLATLTCLVIAFATISLQTFKAATCNPIDALKDE